MGVAYVIVHKDHPMQVNGINSGAEMATLSVAKFLARQGNVVYVAGILKGLTEERETIDGICYIDCGTGYDIAKALSYVEAQGDDYHCIAAGKALPLLLAAHSSNCQKRVFISQDRAVTDSGVSPAVLNAHTDAVICVSQAQKNLFLAESFADEKVHIVHNGIDTNLFQPGPISERDCSRIVFSGALVPDKGIQLLIPAFQRLSLEFPQIKLDVFGSAALWGREPFFDEQAVARSVPGITFHGAVSQEVLANSLSTAGLSIVPSIWFDPYPLVAMEAQGAGCPVIGFAAGGIPEGIVHGKTGLVVEDLTEEGLYQAMKSLLADPELLKEMSVAASERIHNHYTWNHFATAVIEICTTVSERKNDMEETSFGIVTTWNESCGLATYAEYLVDACEGEVPVFASGLRKSDDAPWVHRCWEQQAQSYDALKECILDSGVRAVLFNCQVRFFSYPAITNCIQGLQKAGIQVSVLLHSTFTIDEECRALAQSADIVIVHSAQNRLRLIAHGIDPKRVQILPHGVQKGPEVTSFEIDQVRSRYKLPGEEALLLSFGFIQAHKGMEAVIETVQYLRSKGRMTQGLIVGSTRSDDPGSTQYLEFLRNQISAAGLTGAVTIVDSYVETEELYCLMKAASCIIMNYHSQYFEASGASSLAVASGTPVVTSSAPAFQAFGDAVWQATSGFPIPLSVELILNQEALRNELRSKADRYSAAHTWTKVAQTLQNVLQSAPVKEEGIVDVEVMDSDSASSRILFQNRPNALSQPGGDTRIMEALASGLKLQGLTVEIDCEQAKNPADYDLVHLFNFATPEITEQLARKAHAVGTPFVVTTLCEDVPLFHNQSHAYSNLLQEYVEKGQPSGWYDQASSVLTPPARAERFKNDWVVQHASKLMTTGKRESVVIQRDYRDCPASRVSVVPLGTPFTAAADAKKFVEAYGVEDFVLSVGRLESRKNQLMLLKALEDSELPVVLVAGGFSYQLDYEAAVKKFQRRGKTIICDRLSDEMLASAYVAARVHALCSWYELPGLVSLEAAARHCNIVVTPNGTAPDYFGDGAFYATPQDCASIRNAVMAAYYSPYNEVLNDVVANFQWDTTIQATVAVYEEVLGSLQRGKAPIGSAIAIPALDVEAVSPVPSMPTSTPEPVSSPRPEAVPALSSTADFQELLEKGEQAAQDRNYELAEQYLAEAQKLQPNSFRLLKAFGAIAFAQGNVDEATPYFERALEIDPENPRGLSGMGMCEMAKQQPELAYPRFVKALQQDVSHGATLLQLIECSYLLNRFDDLKELLTQYVAQFPDDPDMRFCLAGALYKSGDIEAARVEVESTLQRKSDHKGACELLERLNEEAAAKVSPVNGAVQTAASETQETGPAASLQDVVKQLEKSAQQLGQVLQPESTRIETGSAIPATEVSAVVEKIKRLEELKKQKNYEDLSLLCQQMLHEEELSAEERDHVELLLAEAGVLQGSIRSSEVVFDRVLQRNQSHPRALCGKGALECFRGNYTQAKQLFEQATSIDPNYDVALAGLGVVASQEGDQENAWTFFGKALAQNPENSRALYGVVELAYPLERLDALEGMLKSFLERQPNNIDCRYSLAGCQYAQGHHADALQSIEQILSESPADARALELKDHIEQTTGVSPVSRS